LAQTLAPDEVLVWDDGSTSETRARLRRLIAEHPDVQLFEGEAAGTPAVGRNRLIKLCRGEWVALLDDDDEWLPKKLELQLPYMRTWDVVGSGARRRSNGSPYISHVGPVSRGNLFRDNVLVLSTVAIRRSALVAEFREDRSLAGIEDYCLWLDLADAGGRIVATPDVVVIYEDTGAARLSATAYAVQKRLARHMLGRWRRRLLDPATAAGALVHTFRQAKLRARRLSRR
jgi:glycosyltransferase involved in cell wall biosynthesis